MKIYIEAIEEGTENEDKDFIKIEVTTNENAARGLAIAAQQSNRIYRLRKHICNHDENKPCTVEDI